MSKVKSIFKRNPEVSRLLVIMVCWLIFMMFTQAEKFLPALIFLLWRDSSLSMA